MAENVLALNSFAVQNSGVPPLCLDGTLKSCYNNLSLKSSDDDLPHINAEVHTHLSENVFAYAITTSA